MSTMPGVRGGTDRVHTVARAYFLVSLAMTGAYPFLSESGRAVIFLSISCASVPMVLGGLRRVAAGDRRPWWLLLTALVALNVGNVARLAQPVFPAGQIAGQVFDTAGNALALAAAVAVVVRRGRNDIGGLIDTAIASMAIGGVLWDVVLLPHLAATGQPVGAQVPTFATVFVLSGVLGALGRLLQTAKDCQKALRLLATALALSLVGNVLVAVRADPVTGVVTAMMFMAGYVALGLFGLDPSATRLARPGPAPRDALSAGRLAVLGAALAAVPVVAGGRQLFGHDVDGLLLAVGGAMVTGLGMVRIGRLVAERASVERALQHQATHDALTGLPNRAEFTERLAAELRRPYGCLVLFCDLDGFKAVNDRLGHAAGDQLLTEVARRLRRCVRERDTVSRFGGDEFLILYREASLGDEAILCARIRAALERPIRLGAESVTIGASLGAVVGAASDANGSGDADALCSAERLIHRADDAMYAAKHRRTQVPAVVASRGAPGDGRNRWGTDAHVDAGTPPMAAELTR